MKIEATGVKRRQFEGDGDEAERGKTNKNNNNDDDDDDGCEDDRVDFWFQGEQQNKARDRDHWIGGGLSTDAALTNPGSSLTADSSTPVRILRPS